MAANKINYTENDRVIVSTLKAHADGLTIAEINSLNGTDIKPGSFTGAVKKGLIEAIGEREVMRTGKRQITLYSYVSSEVYSNAEGKPYTYTEKEQAVLDGAATIEGEFTLAELATAMGLEKLSSGSINGLVKKGNIAKNPEKSTVPCQVKSTVKVYGFVQDIPTEA